MISRGSLTRWLPFLAWPHVTPGKLRLDMIAAITGAVIVLPQAVRVKIVVASVMQPTVEYGCPSNACL